MKVCPNCQRQYPDDDLNFCLDDGSILSQVSGYDAPPTVMSNQPRTTAPNTSFGNENPMQNVQGQPQGYSMQPQKSSKTWIWVLGILGFGVLLCGGGFVGFLAWVGTLDTNTNRNNSNITISNTSTSPTPNDRTSVQTIDLTKWVQENSKYGLTEFTDGEFRMSSKEKGFYYVLTSQKDYKTENATTKVNVRNVDNAPSTLGFGLVVHSNQVPLTQDYAFLIDSVKKRYRIVYHEPGKETETVRWTNSGAIKDGTQPNTLEVRDENGKMDFFINGTLITSVRNVYGFKGGVTGLYSGDKANIGFSDFQISK